MTRIIVTRFLVKIRTTCCCIFNKIRTAPYFKHQPFLNLFKITINQKHWPWNICHGVCYKN